VLGWGAFHGIDGYSGMIIGQPEPDVAVMNMTFAEVSVPAASTRSSPT